MNPDNETQEIRTIHRPALEFLQGLTTLGAAEIASRCSSVGTERMNAIIKTAVAWRHEVEEIADAFKVLPMVLLDSTGWALDEYRQCRKILDERSDVGNFAFINSAMEESLSMRNSTGLPIEPQARRAYYERFKRMGL